MSVSDIPYRLGLQQRVLAPYRAPFFDALAGACSKGLSVFAGTARPEETIGPPAALETAAFYPAHNLHLLSGRFYLCWQFGLLRWLHDWQPEVLVAEANPRYAHTPAALDWMQRRGRPVIGWGLGAPPTAAGWRERSRRRFLARFDAMITYSQKGAEEYAQAGLHPGRIFVAPNAVAPRPQGEAPLHGAGEAGRPVVLFVGRLQPRKRVDLLLRACAALPAERRPQVWIVGDGPARSELEALAAELTPRPVFYGARHGAALEAVWQGADLFVLPGTGGLAIQEAMAHALPVMAAEADGTQADLVRPENGWMLPPGDLATLTRRLDEALGDADRLRRMGAASYRIVAQEINLENMVRVFAQAIDTVMRGA